MSRLGLMWANLFRRRTRAILTLFSLMVAFLLFVLLRTATELFTEGSGFASPGVDRLIVVSKYSQIQSLPISALRRIAGVQGVQAVTHADWFGGIYQDPRNFFPIYPVKPRAWFDMYREQAIDPAHLEAFERTRTGAVAPAGLAERYGWQIGDKIPIQGDIYAKRDGSRLWEFDLVGLYRRADDGPAPSELLFQYDYFDEAKEYEQGQVGWFVVRIADSERAQEIARAIDALFENSPDPTRTVTEAESMRQFMAQLGNIGLMMSGILGAVFFTILLLTGNTMMQALRERIPELAVLKTLGFADGAVAALVLGEALLLSLAGAALGILWALAFAEFAGPALQQIVGEFEVAAHVLAEALGAALLLGLAAGAAPALSARRLAIVDALRRGR